MSTQETQIKNTDTFFCDTVHHWAKYQDVCAAVSTSSQAAVAAKTCGAKHRQATDTLMITEHVLYVMYVSNMLEKNRDPNFSLSVLLVRSSDLYPTEKPQ